MQKQRFGDNDTLSAQVGCGQLGAVTQAVPGASGGRCHQACVVISSSNRTIACACRVMVPA